VRTWFPLLLAACGGSPEEEAPATPLDPKGLTAQDANEGLRMSLAEKSKMAFSLAVEELSDRDLLDVPIQVEVTEQFAEVSGHLMLVGFNDVSPLTLVPEMGAQPMDMQRIGVVSTWPQSHEVQLVDGLHYMAIVSQDIMPGPDDIISTTIQVAGTPSKALGFTLDRTMDPVRGAQRIARDRFKETLQVDIEPRPALSEYGNVFLVGFDSIDVQAQHPAPGTPPVDFQQLGVAIQDWPIQRSVDLMANVYYFALYTVDQQPGAGDPASKPLRIEGASDGPLSLTIRANTDQTPPEQMQLGSRTEWKMNEDQGPGVAAEESPITLEIQADIPLQPDARLFLLGFTELDASGAAPENIRPRDHRMISEDVAAWPMSVEASLVKDLPYFLFYSQGEHPQPGDVSSEAFSARDAPSGEAALEVTLAEAAPSTPPEAPDLPTAPVTTTASMAPPPPASSSGPPPGREWKAFLLALLLGGLAGFLVPRLTARR